MPISPVYQRLVESEDDFLGILAYSVYKRQKSDFLARMAQKYGGHEVPVQEYEAFAEMSQSDLQLAHYRRQAEALLDDFAEAALGEQSEQIRKEAAAFYELKLERLSPSFFMGTLQSGAGSVLFTILVGALVFFLWSLRFGVQYAVENVFDVKITADRKQFGTTQRTDSPPR